MLIRPCFNISAYPDNRFRRSSDFRKLASINTLSAGEKTPISFFNPLKLIPVLPPTDIVEQDPFERGIRKALNLGHTVGHAFESLALETQHPILHGYAVAWGIVCELYFSHIKTGFPKDKLRQTILFIKEHYGVMPFDCKQYERLYEFMKHDKKNSAGIINFTLLTEIGDIQINQSASKDEIFEMLDFYRESMGC